MTILELLWGIFAVQSVADAVLTYKVITQKKGKEVNPIMRKLFSFFGLVPALVITKGVALAVVWFTLGEFSFYVLPLIITLYAGIIFNNYKVYYE